ncbi:MAG: hypothetical protein HOV81_32530 [Kofleriaceae bacterium]|nr:hypothetical protein [Kofleriaceae bacterium]
MAKKDVPAKGKTRLAPMLYSSVGLALCTVLSLGVVALKGPQAAGD